MRNIQFTHSTAKCDPHIPQRATMLSHFQHYCKIFFLFFTTTPYPALATKSETYNVLAALHPIYHQPAYYHIYYEYEWQMTALLMAHTPGSVPRAWKTGENQPSNGIERATAHIAMRPLKYIEDTHTDIGKLCVHPEAPKKTK